MIMSAIFIETFFSTCGACASADAVNASESIAMARNFPINDMFSSLSERSSWRDGYNTTVILIFHRVRWAQSIYLGNLTFVQATAVEFRYSPSTAISWPYNASSKRPRNRRTAEQRDEFAPFDHSIILESAARCFPLGIRVRLRARARLGEFANRAHEKSSATTIRPTPSTSQPGRIISKSNALCSTLSGETLA